MKNINGLFLALIAVFTFSGLSAQQTNTAKQKGLEAISQRAIKGQMEFLASDWTEGRHTGREGAYLAADYIASVFKIYGLEPGGDLEWYYPDREARRNGEKPKQYRSYFQYFDLVEYTPGDSQEFSLCDISKDAERTITFANRTDFSVTTSDVGIELTSPVVFAGYGYVNSEQGYDDFKNLDVKGKVILRLSGYPGHNDTTSKAYKQFNPGGKLSSWNIARSKNNVAREKGVAAIIEVDPDGDGPVRSWADNLPFRYNSRMYEGEERLPSYYDTRQRMPGTNIDGNPPRISISKRALNEILKDSDIDVLKFEKNVKNSLKPASDEISGKKVRIKTSVDSKIVRARNVIGVIPGKDTSNLIVIGGHYDHLGIQGGYIWNGADDNASGTVGAMTVGKACMATGVKPEKTIVVAAWTGEEKGLFGSKYFASNPYKDGNILAYLNYDMISRDNPGDTLGIKCTMNYTEASPQFEEITNNHNEDFDIGLEIRYRASHRPGGGSDHASFSQKDIPIMYFEAGFPPEYHQADDHLSKINWDKLEKIIKIGFLNIWELANQSW